jgi:hypothetical protein
VSSLLISPNSPTEILEPFSSVPVISSEAYISRLHGPLSARAQVEIRNGSTQPDFAVSFSLESSAHTGIGETLDEVENARSGLSSGSAVTSVEAV